SDHDRPPPRARTSEAHPTKAPDEYFRCGIRPPSGYVARRTPGTAAGRTTARPGTDRIDGMTYADLKGKVAVVTGGSRGIGAATVRALAEHGVRVAVNGRDPDAVDAMVAELWQAGATATGVVADVTDAAAVTRMRDRVEGDLGPVDIVAAFAGGGLARPGIPLDQYTEE